MRQDELEPDKIDNGYWSLNPLSKSIETRRIEFAGWRDNILKDNRGKAKKKGKSAGNHVPRKFNVMFV